MPLQLNVSIDQYEKRKFSVVFVSFADKLFVGTGTENDMGDRQFVKGAGIRFTGCE